jgi:hypothetical protein
MMPRKQRITNLYIKDKDIKRLANGYVVYKRANNHPHALIPRQKGELIQAERKAIKIAKLEARIAKLKGKMFTRPEVKYIKAIRPYVKKNPKYWKERSEFMKEHSPLLRKEPLNANN